MDWLTTLQQAGLPVISAGVNEAGKVDATFERGLTPDELKIFFDTTQPEKTPTIEERLEASELIISILAEA